MSNLPAQFLVALSHMYEYMYALAIVSLDHLRTHPDSVEVVDASSADCVCTLVGRSRSASGEATLTLDCFRSLSDCFCCRRDVAEGDFLRRVNESSVTSLRSSLEGGSIGFL